MGKRQPGPYDDTPVFRQRALPGSLKVLRGRYVRASLFPDLAEAERRARNLVPRKPEAIKPHDEYE